MGGSDHKRKSINLDEAVEFDEAITLTGYGKFNYISLAACALGVSIVGFQNGVASYIFPAAQCELDLDSSHLGFLNVAFLIGGMCSCFLWGSIADTSGRKNVLIFSLLANALVSIIFSLSNHVMSLTICRFLNGFFVGAPGSVLLSYLGEFQPPKLRSGIMCGFGVFFTAAWLMLPILSWLILPLNINFTIGSWFIISPWRIFMIILAVPEGLLGLWFFYLPESPKYLLAVGDNKGALDILKNMYAVNKGRSPEDYPVKILYDSNAVESKGCDGNIGCMGTCSRMLREMWTQMKTIFKPPLLFLTFLACTIMFTNMFGAFGLGLWLPELFIRFQKYADLYPNDTVSLDKLALLSVVENKTCDSTFDLSVIRSTVVTGMTSLIASAVCGYISTKVSIKTVPFACMLLGGLAAASIYWLTSATQNLIVSSIFQATMIIANMSLSGVIVELFPTTVGATAICLSVFMGRMGAMTANVVFGLLMDTHCEIPIFTVAANVLLGAVLCIVIPSGKPKDKGNQNSYKDGKIVEISLVSLPPQN